MQSLSPECLATALHLEKRLEKQNRNDSTGKQKWLHAERIEHQKDLRRG